MRSAYPGQECCREQEDIPAECELELIGNMRHVSLVTYWTRDCTRVSLCLLVASVACNKQYLPNVGPFL